jgi:hypothetical protein
MVIELLWLIKCVCFGFSYTYNIVAQCLSIYSVVRIFLLASCNHARCDTVDAGLAPASLA